MSNKVMIVGTGNVGASVAFSLINQRTAVNELVLTDINAEDAEGEAMDLRDALAVAPSFLKISSGTYADAKDCDIVVIAAGAAQKPGETRMDLLKKNAAIIKSIPIGIIILICINIHQMFFFFSTTIIFQSTLHAPANTHINAPTINSVLCKIIPARIMLAPKNNTGIASTIAKPNVKPSGTIFLFILLLIKPLLVKIFRCSYYNTK